MLPDISVMIIAADVLKSKTNFREKYHLFFEVLFIITYNRGCFLSLRSD